MTAFDLQDCQIQDISHDAHSAYQRIVDGCRSALWQGQCPLQIAAQDICYQHHDEMHFHAHPELFIQLSGCNHFRCPTHAFDLLAGQMAIMPAGVPHAETFDPGTDEGDFLCLVIMPNHAHTGILSAHTKEIGHKQTIHYVGYPAVSTKHFSTILQQCIQLYPEQALCAQQLLASLCTMLLAIMEQPFPAEDRMYSPKIRSCRNFIHERFADTQCTVHMLAKELSCTPNYLSARFKKECGESLSHYLNMRRLHHASDLLLHTDLSIQHIAWSCGFNSPSYFIARFQEAYGETPGSFKRQVD